MTIDVDRAIRDTIHDFPGGVEAVAKRLAKAPGTIYNKADPACETHQLTVKEALALMLAHPNFAIARTLCREIGHACIPLGDFSNCSDVELLDCYTRYHAEVGETAGALREALNRGSIDSASYLQIRREIHEDIEAELALLSRVEGLVRE